MSSITTRAAKGSALTHAEVDANFTNLNSGKAEVSGQTFTGSVTLPAGSATAAGVKVGTGTTYAPGLYSPGTDQLAISTGGTGRLFVDSLGTVEIGTLANPTIGTFARPTLYLKQFSDPSSAYAGIHLEASGETSVLGIGYNGTAQAFVFDTSYRSTGAFRPITFPGRVLVGTTSANTSGAKLQTADGITFPAAQVASADPNTLDDYEEGTFTPTVTGATTAGTGTYSIQVGRYTKVGNRVQFTVYMVWTGHTGTGAMRVSGLPFTSSTVANTLHAISIWQQNITLTAGTLMMGYVLNSNTQVGLSEIATGGGTQATVAMDPSGDIIVTGVYEV